MEFRARLRDTSRGIEERWEDPGAVINANENQESIPTNPPTPRPILSQGSRLIESWQVREPFCPVSDYTGGAVVPNIDSSAIDDELLAIRCQLGESAAFDDLIARWHGPLWAFARRLTGDDEAAREIVQDVWLRAIRNHASVTAPSCVPGCLASLAEH